MFQADPLIVVRVAIYRYGPTPARRYPEIIYNNHYDVAQFTTDAAQMAMQAGPPADLPGPSFVGEILGEVGSTAGDAAGGLGETISELTPGGAEVSDGANSTASDAAENAPGR